MTLWTNNISDTNLPNLEGPRDRLQVGWLSPMDPGGSDLGLFSPLSLSSPSEDFRLREKPINNINNCEKYTEPYL